MSEESPKVSIIMVTYNHQDYIAEAIESVLGQTYKNIELIVADDGSTDNNPAIINEYAGKHSIIKPILAKENQGLAYNLNRALKAVEGQYVAWLDGDDLMFPQKIEKQVKYLNTNLDVIACGHDLELFRSPSGESLGRHSRVISTKKLKGKMDVKSLFDPTFFICPLSAIMVRREYIPAHGFDTRLKYATDLLFYIEVFRNGKLGYIDEVLGKYRRHSKNLTGSDAAEKVGFEERLIMLSIVMARYPELYKLIKKRRTAFYVYEAVDSVKRGDKKRAKTISKVLISEGSFIRGLLAHALSQILSQGLVNKAYNSKYRKRLTDILRKVA